MGAGAMMAVRLTDLTLGYDRRPAVHHLTGAFEPGSLTAVVGMNGSGKSTLLKGLAGALRPLGGTIDLGDLGPRDIAYLPQDVGLDRRFPMTLAELVGLGLWSRRGLFGKVGAADRARAAQALTAVGLEGLEGRSLDQVSGGQLQRALFARVLAQDAQLIVLDEPFSALDAAGAIDLTRTLAGWAQEGRTVVVASHDLDLVRALCPHTLILAREPIAWGETAQVLTADNLRRGESLSEGWRQGAEVCHRHEHAA